MVVSAWDACVLMEPEDTAFRGLRAPLTVDGFGEAKGAKACRSSHPWIWAC